MCGQDVARVFQHVGVAVTDEAVIAIDGPSGVGKTSVSRTVARRLSTAHLDTGAFYRIAAIVAIVSRIDIRIEADVLSVVARAAFDYSDGVMSLEGIDMSAAIRSDVVTQMASQIAVFPSIRSVLVRRQRDWVARHDGRAVVEGRDIGTVVFPEAPLKVYLTARPDVRAARRAGESALPVAEVQGDLAQRDTTDSMRSASPLAAADDAVVLDTSDVAEEDVIDQVLDLARDRGLHDPLD